MTSLDDLARSRYIRLTTFKKDGTGVPTPVWVVPDGDGALLVPTEGTTGKAKRIRGQKRATAVPCSARGTVVTGAAEVELAARVTDDAGGGTGRPGGGQAGV